MKFLVATCVCLGTHRAQEAAAHGQVQEQVASLTHYAMSRISIAPSGTTHTTKGSAVVAIGVDRHGEETSTQPV